MARTKDFYTSDFYCTKCGNRGIPLPRRVQSQREPGHLKKLFCLHCKTETNHAEIRPFGKYKYNNFLEEFESGKFKEAEEE